MNRRELLRSALPLSVAGGIAVSGCLNENRSTGESTPNAPYGINTENSDTDWRLAFEDEFDQGELDPSVWNIGYGWGRQHSGWEYVRDEDVWVDDENDRLVLQADYNESHGPVDGDEPPHHWYGGGVNTRDNVYQKQGYWEARIRLPEIVKGITPAFWAKPNTEEFPPEMDVMEHFSVANKTWSAIHWARNGIPPSDSKDGLQTEYSAYTHDDNPRENFVVYGAHWQDDRTEFYIDGNRYHTVSDGHSDDPKLREMNYGEPFYTMFSTQFSDTWGDPTQYDNYPYHWEVDWIRIWESVSGEDDADE